AVQVLVSSLSNESPMVSEASAALKDIASLLNEFLNVSKNPHLVLDCCSTVSCGGRRGFGNIAGLFDVMSVAIRALDKDDVDPQCIAKLAKIAAAEIISTKSYVRHTLRGKIEVYEDEEVQPTTNSMLNGKGLHLMMEEIFLHLSGSNSALPTMVQMQADFASSDGFNGLLEVMLGEINNLQVSVVQGPIDNRSLIGKKIIMLVEMPSHYDTPISNRETFVLFQHSSPGVRPVGNIVLISHCLQPLTVFPEFCVQASIESLGNFTGSQDHLYRWEAALHVHYTFFTCHAQFDSWAILNSMFFPISLIGLIGEVCFLTIDYSAESGVEGGNHFFVFFKGNKWFGNLILISSLFKLISDIWSGDNEFLCYSGSLSQPTESEQYYVSPTQTFTARSMQCSEKQQCSIDSWLSDEICKEGRYGDNIPFLRHDNHLSYFDEFLLKFYNINVTLNCASLLIPECIYDLRETLFTSVRPHRVYLYFGLIVCELGFLFVY
ncbi:hypothetical protein Pfo_020514, partial [Paulownia fortunei]